MLAVRASKLIVLQIYKMPSYKKHTGGAFSHRLSIWLYSKQWVLEEGKAIVLNLRLTLDGF